MRHRSSRHDRETFLGDTRQDQRWRQDLAAIARSWRSVCALGMVCAFPLSAGIHIAHAAWPVPTVRRFVLPAVVDGPLAVAGNTVAWVTRPGLCHPKVVPSTCNLASYLHLTDIRSFQPHTIARFSDRVSHVTVLLSQNRLVWMSSRYPTGGWWVWSRDLPTGRKTLIDSSQAEGGLASAPPSLSLRGDTLAWTRNDCFPGCLLPGLSSVTIVNLDSGSRRTIAIHHGRCWILSAPTLAAHTLIWTEQPIVDTVGCGGDSRVQVMRLNRTTGAIRQITIQPPRGKVAFDIAGNDRFLAWTQESLHTDADSRVMLMDTRTGRAIPVTTVGGGHPSMNSDLLVWHGQYGSTIGALDLHTWRYYLLTRNQNTAGAHTGPGSFGPPSGKRVVWDEFRFRDTGGPSKDSLAIADLP